jgi:hypothetical protein
MDNHLIPNLKTVNTTNLFIAYENPFELNSIKKFVQTKIHLKIMGESSSLLEAFEQCKKFPRMYF